jgi:hypothetical protein
MLSILNQINLKFSSGSSNSVPVQGIDHIDLQIEKGMEKGYISKKQFHTTNHYNPAIIKGLL